MNKPKLNKRSIKIVGATSLALFSLVTVFTATFAWFVLRQDVSGTGIKMKATDETGRLNKIEIFEYVETIDKGTGNSHAYNFSFKDEPFATIYGGDGIDDYFLMGDYNPLSPDHPVLILFTLKGEFTSVEAGDMYIKGSTGTPGFLGATSGGSPVYKLGTQAPTLCLGQEDVPTYDEITGEPIVDDEGSPIMKEVDVYPLSSAVNFKCADYSSDTYDDLIDASTTNRIDIPTNSIEIKESFVNFLSAENIRFEPKPTIYSSTGDGSSIQYIAMVVNYDPDAISAIYSTYLGDSTLEGTYGGQLYFTCDWSLEVF